MQCAVGGGSVRDCISLHLARAYLQLISAVPNAEFRREIPSLRSFYSEALSCTDIVIEHLFYLQRIRFGNVPYRPLSA